MAFWAMFGRIGAFRETDEASVNKGYPHCYGTCSGDILTPECGNALPPRTLVRFALSVFRLARCSVVVLYLIVGECFTHRIFQEEIL